jgi:hypothetical protein
VIVDPRRSTVPAVAAVAVGIAIFLLDSALHPRPGPIPYLLTPTPVALLLYVRIRPTAGRRRLVGLAAWGFAGTTAAGLGSVLVAIGTRLPRPYAAWEFFLLDFGAFLWFVAALAGAFVAAARTDGWRATAALVAGPVAQFSGILLLSLVLAEDVVVLTTPA